MPNDSGSNLELIVRSAIPESFGYFETNQPDLQGTPDIIFRQQRVIVFVHGCYWHRHQDCPLAIIPSKDFIRWLRIFNTNVQRDARALNELRAQGWQCLVFWECEINSKLEKLIDQLADSLGVVDY